MTVDAKLVKGRCEKATSKRICGVEMDLWKEAGDCNRVGGGVAMETKQANGSLAN